MAGFRSNVTSKRARNFASDTGGNATIESVLWLPVFFAIFGLMADAAMIFNGYSRVLRVVQDANRSLSVGRLDDEDAAETYVLGALNQLSPNALADTQIDAGIATTTVRVPASDLEVLGMFGALNSLTITVTSQQLIEN